MAPVFSAADLKTPVRDLLPMNAVVPVLARDGDYVNIGPGFVHQRHMLPEVEKDFVAVAERFLGAPYVWGGKTVAGLDCSGLIQTALQAVGKAAPRDTDMMEKALGERALAEGEMLQRGDLVFWKGHMGVMLDEKRLLHANALHMMVAIEPLADAIARIECGGRPRNVASSGFDLGVGADLAHRLVVVGDPEKKAVQQRQRPHHLARHIQEQHDPDLIGLIGGFVQESVVEQHRLAFMPEIFLALLDRRAIAVA